MKRLVYVYSVAAAVGILALATQPATAVLRPKRATGLLIPPNFNYQVSFGTDYERRKTPPGFTSGISAWTQTKVSWQSDGKGGVTVTLDIDRKASWVLDWVFNPKTIGLTQSDVAFLLAHEQVHFDLSALAVREFLKQAQGRTGAQQQALWNSFFATQGRVQQLDNLYESSTQLGLKRDKQSQWTQKIRSLKNRPDGTFTQLEQWAQSFRNAALKRSPPRAKN